MRLWQIASGDTGRDYSAVFLEHDVMLIGPGEFGEWGDADYSGEPMAPQIRSFVEDPRPGDIVLLRNGHHVVSVGRIPSVTDTEYSWKEQFGDVLGWDLQHVRRVLWHTPTCNLLDGQQPVFANYKQQRTFHQVHEERLTAILGDLDAAIPDRELRPLPSTHSPLSLDEVGANLFAAGVSNDSVEAALAAIRKARRLRGWYWTGDAGERPNEVESVTHMVVPLMAGLGWSEQLLAVEWRRIDLSFFGRTPTVPENCVMICEAKSPGRGLSYAFHQAKAYVEKHELVACNRILVTDGTLYLVYNGKEDDWPDTPSAYVNLLRIQENNVLPGTAGGLDALRCMIPHLKYGT